MSGTSADGVDAVLVEFSGRISHPKWKIINTSSLQYPFALQRTIIEVSQGLKLNSSEWLALEDSITQFHSEVALNCDPHHSADLIGCHGQTVWHRPPAKGILGASLQIIRAPLLAQLIRCPVVFNFRAADLAMGGQGAPLVPLVDDVLIGRGNGWRAILNLGGIANLTILPPSNGPESQSKVLGWDCGPANSLIDLAIREFTNDQLYFDEDGLIASKGKPDELVISNWLKEGFFQLPPPRSTGREFYGLDDLKRRMIDMSHLSKENQISTLTAFTASIVAQDLNNLYSRHSIRPVNLFVAGGGANNPVMINQIINRCKGITVLKLNEIGVSIKEREALAFALLAFWNFHKFPVDCSYITGSNKPIILGIKVDFN